MELKLNRIDKKHIIVFVISIVSIIIGLLNMTYAFFKDSKSSEVVLESANSFGTSTIVKTNVFLDGELNYSNNKNQGLNSKNSLAIKYDDVTSNDYLISLVAQNDPLNTNFLESEGSLIKYEVYHKNDVGLDTSNFNCNNNQYNNGITNDSCQIGTFENKLDGTSFELLKDYRIKDTNNHYFDVYIYLTSDIGTKKIKANFFFLTSIVEKEIYKQELLKGSDPDLSTGLIPVIYDSTNGSDTHWFVADTTKKWYSYTEEEQWWANAVSVDSTTTGIREKYVNTDGTFKKGIEISSSDMLAMFVWIPRYSYTIGCTDINNDGSVNTAATTDSLTTECLGYKVNNASDLSVATPGAIDIKFVSVDDNLETYTGNSPIYTYTSSQRNPSNYYTHPAFDFGGKKLSGLWVGKFETSVKESSDCYTSSSECAVSESDIRILPNVKAFRNKTLSNQFTYSQYLSKNNIYGLVGDTHIMKNNEWAVVAYLSQSIYGKYGNSQYTLENKEIYKNNSTGWFTGRSLAKPVVSGASTDGTYMYDDIEISTGNVVLNSGTGASTTGNIYGVYDMVGGAAEYVMGNYNNYLGSSGFDASWLANNSKYYDKFTVTKPFTVQSKETVGNALIEVLSWYNDNSISSLFADMAAFTARSTNSRASVGGIFYFNPYDGSSSSTYSFRITLVK